MITIKSPAEIKEEIHQALEKKNREAWDKALVMIEDTVKDAASRGEQSIQMFKFEAPVYISGRFYSEEFTTYLNKRIEQEYKIPAISEIFEEIRKAGYKLSVECSGSARHYYEITYKKCLFKKIEKSRKLCHEGPTRDYTVYDLGKILPDLMLGPGQNPYDRAEELLREEQGLKTEFYHISIRWT